MDDLLKVAPSADTPSVLPKIRLKKWEAVSLCRIKVDCPICLSDLTDKCAADCTAEECPIVEGDCKGQRKHLFHEHCIKKHLESPCGKSRLCPLDNQPWKVRRYHKTV